MGKCYSIEVILNDILIIRFTEKPSVEDLRDAITEISEKYKSTKRIWDLSQIDLDLTGEQLEYLSECARSAFKQPSKIAIVASKDLEFGLFRVYEVYRQDEQSTVRVFRKEADARYWLSEDNASSI